MNFTNEDIQRYTRIVTNWLFGMLTMYGLVSPDASWIVPVSGLIGTVVLFFWSVYGNRIQAKINEIANITIASPSGETVKLVSEMKLNDSVTAAAAPSNVVTAPTAVK